MSASNLNHYFSSHPAAFGFWAHLLPDNITKNPTNKCPNQSLTFIQALVQLFMPL